MNLMRRAIFLSLIFVVSMLSPLAIAATTETQFKDGTTSYSHTFSQTGNGSAGVVSIPYGADVTSAQFNLRGDASQTSWTNFSTNDHYGGEGDERIQGKSSSAPSPFQTVYRDNLEATGQSLYLKGNPTQYSPQFSSSSQVSQIGSATMNTTGEFVALSDQGYVSPTKQYSDITVSGGSWTYTGVVIPVSDDQIHVLRYTSTSMTGSPTIQRYNATTGVYLGTASMSYGSPCNTNAYRSIHDADIYNGEIYTAHYSYYSVAKWRLNAAKTSWTCQAMYSYNYPNYVTGVDFDDTTGKMYVAIYDTSARNHYVKEVNPASPTVVYNSWLMLSTSYYYDYGAGLTVSMPNIAYNIYYYNTGYKSVHYHYSMQNGFLNPQGQRTMPGGGHYGMVDTDDHKVYFSCHYYASSAYCSQGQRKIHVYGDGAHFDVRTSSASNQMIVGQAVSVTQAIDSLTLDGVFGSTPTGTSIRVDLSNDGGTTWRAASIGQKIIFPNTGTSILWRATLNGSASKTPVLGDIALSYTTNYQTSGYYYAYQYVGSGAKTTVAATINWTETGPSNTAVKVNLGYSSSTACTSGSSGVVSFTSPNQTKSMTGTGYYLCLRIELSTSQSRYTPSLTDLTIAMHSNAPQQPGIDIDGTNVFTWPAQNGALLGPLTVTSSSYPDIVDTLNKAIPDSGAGVLVTGLNPWVESCTV
ncbi:MAG: hypothetical protein CMA65_07250 [Euryarchaeota archaeon]|nr:hypothetical protein [Euryarchaeota archaeon]